MKKKKSKSGLVYSTASGRMCPGCNQPVEKCSCSTNNSNAGSGDGVVRVGRETKGRRGKAVTLVRGLNLSGVELLTLAKDLKTKCGSGGSLKDGIILIQGDHRDLVVAELLKRGIKAKKSGG